jgi:hypothetical protein
MSRDYQDEYDRHEVETHGGSSGNYTADPAQMAEPQREPVYGPESAAEAQPWGGEEYAPQEPYYEPEEYVEDDPFGVRQMVQEELAGPYAEDVAAWQAEQEQQQALQQTATERVHEAQVAEAALENLDGLIEQALPGGRDMLQELPEFRTAVLERVSNEWTDVLTAGIAQGYDAAMIQERLSAHAPGLVAKAVAETREQYGTEMGFREARAMYFRGAS